jgi:hypothetical protein
MAYPAPNHSGAVRRAASAQPTITVTSAGRCVVAGTGFVPDHEVTIRVAYTADDASDFLTFTADGVGELCAEIPTSADRGTLQITATDHRSDRVGAQGLLWSNTETIDACGK